MIKIILNLTIPFTAPSVDKQNLNPSPTRKCISREPYRQNKGGLPKNSLARKYNNINQKVSVLNELFLNIDEVLAPIKKCM